MKFSAMLWFMGLWAILVYAPIAHWVWGPDGFLNSTNDAAPPAIRALRDRLACNPALRVHGTLRSTVIAQPYRLLA
jgi:Ammonium Transporter Family